MKQINIINTEERARAGRGNVLDCGTVECTAILGDTPAETEEIYEEIEEKISGGQNKGRVADGKYRYEVK